MSSSPEYNRKYNAEHREAQRAWLAAHPDARKEHTRRHMQKYREFVRGLKVGKVCCVCPESNPDKLDFHHIDPATKLFSIGGPVHSRKAVLAEVAKCELRCKKCHGKLHGKGQI